MPSGYSCAGVVVDVGEGVTDIHAGDRVACAGAGYANHAAVNVVPRNLVARIPDAVSFEEAAFATLGAIALQGVRRAEPGLGDRVAVLGLGLLGQITAQMLHAAGAVVIGVDVRPDRVARAQALGLDQGFTVAERDFVAGVLERTEGRGADAVIVTAAGGDAGLLNKAFEACRRKGRVVLVGDVPIRIQRDKIYKKEIDFLISTSYGPGRYDAGLRGEGPGLPVRLRALDRGPQPRGGPAPGRGGVSPREAARRRDAPGRERRARPTPRSPRRTGRSASCSTTTWTRRSRHRARSRTARSAAPRRRPWPAPSASGWWATAGTSAPCCCRC